MTFAARVLNKLINSSSFNVAPYSECRFTQSYNITVSRGNLQGLERMKRFHLFFIKGKLKELNLNSSNKNIQRDFNIKCDRIAKKAVVSNQLRELIEQLHSLSYVSLPAFTQLNIHHLNCFKLKMPSKQQHACVE